MSGLQLNALFFPNDRLNFEFLDLALQKKLWADVSDFLKQIEKLSQFKKEVLWFSIVINLQLQAVKNQTNQKKIHQHNVVEVIHVDDLNYEDFLEKYCAKNRPVIIEGLKVSTVPWTMEHIADVAGTHEKIFFLN